MQCKEWDDANSELFKESHDEAVHKNSYKSRLYDLISASLECCPAAGSFWLIFCVPQGFAQLLSEKGACVTGFLSCFLSTLSMAVN